jgi:HK97 family phage prohead protease
VEIRIRGDSVEIDGYVNAVERKSKPLWSRMGRFLERICKGAFSKALSRNDNVRILLNHDKSRDLGGQKDGNLELCEDSIGLRARATITDPEVVQKAKDGNLVGWSFGFYDRDVLCHTDEDGMPLRDVRDLDLEEVSLLDNTKTPAYDGTLVMVRADESSIYFGETFADEIQIREETREETEEVPKQQETVEKNINYDEWESLIADMKS